jgi:hypothetical protein
VQFKEDAGTVTTVFYKSRLAGRYIHLVDLLN